VEVFTNNRRICKEGEAFFLGIVAEHHVVLGGALTGFSKANLFKNTSMDEHAAKAAGMDAEGFFLFKSFRVNQDQFTVLFCIQ